MFVFLCSKNYTADVNRSDLLCKLSKNRKFVTNFKKWNSSLGDSESKYSDLVEIISVLKYGKRIR